MRYRLDFQDFADVLRDALLAAHQESAPQMTLHRTRRKRHQAKQKLNHGSKAIRRHRRKGGRTGSVFSKRVHAK